MALNLTSAELLSYIINVTPELKADIDLPVQGQSIKPIGELIVNNDRYKNAFINTVNLIGLTLIKRNNWDNPWETFTNKGTLRYGQQIREMIIDLAKSYDYNSTVDDPTHFLETEVPDVYQYIHEVNFQKYYKTSIREDQLRMAFESEDLVNYITETISMLYQTWSYDKYCVDKYMLCRRILDGTLTSVEIDDYSNKTVRQVVSAMKGVSNKMTFRSPNYNPAGVRRATAFGDQYLILNSQFEASMETEVLATSFFRNDAEFKTNAALIDSFSDHDTTELAAILGDQYVAFTDEELAALAAVPAVLISEDFFMDYFYSIGSDGMLSTEFLNPETLERNYWLHVWAVFSTSPYANAVVFTADVTPGVTGVTVSPTEATLLGSAGGTVQFTADVETTGFANKAVAWTIDPADAEAIINQSGKLTLTGGDITVSEYTITATSIYDQSVTGSATLTVQ